MHDKPTLVESQKIWKQTADAFAVSTDGGVTYTAGFDAEGNAVFNVLSAIGVNVEWLRGKYLMSNDGATLIDLDLGVANSDNISITDNVASGYPLRIPFNIDEDTGVVNKVRLKWSIDKFRTYSDGAKSGGEISKTSSTNESTIVVSQLTGNFKTLSTEVTEGANSAIAVNDGSYSGSTKVSAGSGGTGPHSHSFDVPSHMHVVNNPNHSHGYHSHYFNIDHAHGVTVEGHSHIINIPPHSHNLQFGIMETPVISNEIDIYVNGILRKSVDMAQGVEDLTQWITTVGWHEIELRSTTLKRISARLAIKSYIKM